MSVTLLITEAGLPDDAPKEPPETYHIVLDFAAIGDACSAVGGDKPPRRFLLGTDWRCIRARFAPFVLARSTVEYLLAERPRRVVVDPLSGASLELARLATALGFDVTVRLPEQSRIDLSDRAAMRWLHGLLTTVPRLLAARTVEDEVALRQHFPDLAPAVVDLPPVDDAPIPSLFGYEAYALGRRDHALLVDMQAGFARHFDGCARVLDLGCGTGVFLEILAQRAIPAVGVERNAMSARFARSLGHEVVGEDALDFLESGTESFDGVYCSHFIEHLPVDAAERLLGGVARVLKDGGIAVFVFPDPESIRSQLLGFWRDPEHVRFYHPELVELMAGMAGLQLVASSLNAPGRQVVPFRMQAPLPPPTRPATNGWRARVLRRLGIADAAELAAERARSDALEAALRQLWAVNQTWAWDDNAVLCFRKRPARSPVSG
ncbi:MAG: methyltransferase domain-containing protein [Chromatiaceae bacterium]|nr:methyltransferase domain-containing protein [Chromatiaceae bacterium]